MLSPCEIVAGLDAPLIAAAIHNGHTLRPEVAERLALDEAERLREEDPFTGSWTTLASTRIVGTVSRFEVDLNRPREKAVYLKPEDSWGLQVWKAPLPPAVLEGSLRRYDTFYAEARALFDEVQRRFGRFVVLDLHNYNHRRAGPDSPPADPLENPEINIGTGSMDRTRWARVVERFKEDMAAFDFLGRGLDVRENVRFFGGHFPTWIHQTYPESGCALAIEVKKFFMDEWTGEPYPEQLAAVERALAATVPGVLAALEEV